MENVVPERPKWASDLLALASDDVIPHRARRIIAEVLIELGRLEDAVFVLLAIVRGKGEGNIRTVRLEAIETLGKLGRIGELITIARDEQVVNQARYEAIDELGRLGRREELLSLAGDEQVKPAVRQRAAEMLGKLGWGDEALPIMVALLSRGQLKGLTLIKAVVALGWIGDIYTLPYLERIASDDSDKEAQKAAKNSIEKIRKRIGMQ